jgi:hypothetical protein
MVTVISVPLTLAHLAVAHYAKDNAADPHSMCDVVAYVSGCPP